MYNPNIGNVDKYSFIHVTFTQTFFINPEKSELNRLHTKQIQDFEI